MMMSWVVPLVLLNFQAVDQYCLAAMVHDDNMTDQYPSTTHSQLGQLNRNRLAGPVLGNAILCSILAMFGQSIDLNWL